MNINNTDPITILKEIYKPVDSSYILVMMPLLICFFTGIITMYYVIKIDLNVSNLDWEKNRCVPKYMFVSGFIQKEKNLGILGSIDTNFKKCVYKLNRP
jgi:hypothetical protein